MNAGTFFPRFRRCRGLRLPLGKRRQLEIWFCPRGETIPLHAHGKIHSRLLCLWGRMRWKIKPDHQLIERDVLGPIRRRHTSGWMLSYFHVRANVPHGAEVLGRLAVFANLSRVADPAATIESASRDIQFV